MRSDLLALTPEALAVLSNMGLVKRAQKEIASGQGPVVHEKEDGAVVGRFPDGIESTLAAGKRLQDGSCTCGATAICRHRLATVLVYAEHADPMRSSPSVEANPNPTEGQPRVGVEELAPEQSELALREYLGRRVYDKAVKLKNRTRATVESEGLVHLDTCSVRFLSGRRLDFARCDCRAVGPCEHLAVALWALQGTLTHGPAPLVSLEAMEPALNIVREVIEHGVSHLGQGLGSRFVEARQGLLRQSMVWPHTLLEEVEAELGYYQTRGGRYKVAGLARSLASLWARRQVSANDPSRARAVLGLNQAPETSLRQLRLTGLGCRLDTDDTQYYLADSSTGKVLVLTLPTGSRPAGLTPSGLAGGQLVTASAHRRANGMLRLGRGHHSLTGCGSWEHLTLLYGPPPCEERLLGECHAAPGVRILPVEQVLGGYYSPGQQELSLLICSREGLIARCVLAHRSATPFALECLWGARVGLRAVAGVMEREGHEWLVRPTALLCDGEVRVPDLARSGSLEEVPLGQNSSLEDPLAGALEAALSCWHDTLQRGLGSGQARVRQAAIGLRKVGMERTAAQLESAGQPDDWLLLATRLEVARQLTAPSDGAAG